jgi:hypothetical protein
MEFEVPYDFIGKSVLRHHQMSLIIYLTTPAGTFSVEFILAGVGPRFSILVLLKRFIKDEIEFIS